MKMVKESMEPMSGPDMKHHDDFMMQHESEGHKHHSKMYNAHSAGHKIHAEHVKAMCGGGMAKGKK
jgi:hypothetical protein